MEAWWFNIPNCVDHYFYSLCSIRWYATEQCIYLFTQVKVECLFFIKCFFKYIVELFIFFHQKAWFGPFRGCFSLGVNYYPYLIFESCQQSSFNASNTLFSMGNTCFSAELWDHETKWVFVNRYVFNFPGNSEPCDIWMKVMLNQMKL